MRCIIVLRRQRRDRQQLGLVLHTSETVHCRECKRRTREKETAILGCYGRACCPWTAWEKAVVSPDFSQVCEMCWVAKLRDGPAWDAVFHRRVPNFPRLLTKDSLKKGKTDLLLMLSCDFSFMTVLRFHVDFGFLNTHRAWYIWNTPIPWYPPTCWNETVVATTWIETHGIPKQLYECFVGSVGNLTGWLHKKNVVIPTTTNTLSRTILFSANRTLCIFATTNYHSVCFVIHSLHCPVIFSSKYNFEKYIHLLFDHIVSEFCHGQGAGFCPSAGENNGTKRCHQSESWLVWERMASLDRDKSLLIAIVHCLFNWLSLLVGT